MAEETHLPEWQKSMPTIHNLEHSQAMRVVWALEELAAAKGLNYNIKNYPRVRPKNPDLLKISPLGKSPILTVETLNGNPLPNLQVRDGVIMESRLIIHWLADNYGGRELWEQDSEEDRRRDTYFQEFAMDSLLERVDQAMIFELMPQMMPFPLKQILGVLFSPVAKIFRDFHVDYFEFMESELSEERPWFAGKKIGIADFCFEFPMSVAVARGYVDEKKYPKIMKWYVTLTARPAYQKAIEKGGGKRKYDLLRFGQ
jgi:glutathione S-transferase